VPEAFPQSAFRIARTSPDVDKRKRSSSQPSQIGVAKASFFPASHSQGRWPREQRIESVHQRTLPDLVRRAQCSAAVFQGGALRSGLRLSRAQYQEQCSLISRLQNSLEQVSNALIAYQKDRDFRGQQELLTQAASGPITLVGALSAGGASYLQC